jgi:hypothetical protein
MMTGLAQNAARRQRVVEMRDALLALHKALIESERERYEETIGAIRSPQHFLELLTRDPWFAWLQPLSQLIVSMDETLDEEDPIAASTLDDLTRRSGRLLIPSEHENGFPGHYYNALQSDPGVVMAHADVIRRIGRPGSRN